MVGPASGDEPKGGRSVRISGALLIVFAIFAFCFALWWWCGTSIP